MAYPSGSSQKQTRGPLGVGATEKRNISIQCRHRIIQNPGSSGVDNEVVKLKAHGEPAALWRQKPEANVTHGTHLGTFQGHDIHMRSAAEETLDERNGERRHLLHRIVTGIGKWRDDELSAQRL